MRKTVVVVVLLCYYLMSWAQVNSDSLNINWKEHWTIEGKTYIYISQGAQFHWAKGGDNVFSFLSKTEVKAKYKKEKQIWDNQLNWNYGFLFMGVPQDNTIQYRTTDDYIEINSSYGYKATGKVYYNALFNFKTQLLPGYKYPNDSVKVSNFLSPAYIIFSIGLNYKPNEVFKVMLSPITSKTTLVVKEGDVDETKFGLKKGERIYKEIGAYLTFYQKIKLFENISLENNLTLFSNYEKNPENVDFELKSDFNFKINKFVKALISLHFIYDDDASIPINDFDNGVYKQIGYTKGLQFQEKIMVGVGIDF